MPWKTLRRLWRGSPSGFLGMIVLVAIIENQLTRFQIHVLPPIQYQWRTQSRVSRQQAVGAEVLCLGDSLITYGVIPTILENRLGRRTYNLALGGGQFPAHYFFLRRALESGARPSALVIEAIPLHLRISAEKRIPLWSNLLTTTESLEMAWVARDPDFLASVLLAEHLTSWQSRLEIRQNILASLNGSPLSYREINLVAERNLQLNQGALIGPPKASFEILPRYHDWIYPEEITIDRLNGHYLERFLELAGSRGIPVFWLLTPICAEIQTRGELTGTSAIHARFLREIQKRHPHVTVVDARRSRYPQRFLDDSMHLARSGAAIFSADLADAMARVLDGNLDHRPWIELPAFRDRVVTFRHEDLNDSKQRLVPTLK